MISVDAALANIFSLITVMDTEEIPLAQAHNRVLARDVVAERNQPPFASSAMDGYAMLNADAKSGNSLRVMGESAAGHAFGGQIGPRETARIFTGAPVPNGLDRVVIQEDVTRDGDTITIGDNIDAKHYIRPDGSDFSKGQALTAPRILTPSDLALLAAMNAPTVQVYRKPVVALISTGDELVMPGETPKDDQIISSNTFGLAPLVELAGGHARVLPIARDNRDSLKMAFKLASDADLIVTIGGASVGDHDLVGKVAGELGLDQSFYKVAMRPGKPLMAGRLGKSVMLGLPGNPVSSMVCGTIFMQPAIRAMAGLPAIKSAPLTATLATDLRANGPREHYMRAKLENGEISAFDRQDSSLLTVFSHANALLIRPVNDGARKIGDQVQYLPL